MSPDVVRIHIMMTDNHPKQADLFVEVVDAGSQAAMPVKAFASLKAAAVWLQEEGFEYVRGTNGVWARPH